MEIKNIQDAVTAYKAQISSIMIVEAPDELSRNFIFSNLMEELVRQKESVTFNKFFRFDSINRVQEMTFVDKNPIINGKPYQKIFNIEGIGQTYGKANSPEDILDLYKISTTVMPTFIQHHIDYGRFFEGADTIFTLKTFIRNYYNISGNNLPVSFVENAKQRKLWDEEINQGKGRQKRSEPRNFKRDSLIVFIVDNLAPYEDLSNITIQVPSFVVRESDRNTLINGLLDRYKVQSTGKQKEQIIGMLKPVDMTELRNFHLELEKANVKTIEDVLSTAREFIKKTMVDLSVIEYLDSDVTFDQIGGFGHVKETIENNILNVWKHKSLANQMKVEYEKGIILYGPPGTGKTQFARAIARELNLPVFKFDISKVLSKWVGESERNLRTVFEMLERLDPCILFIDEIDSIGGNRSGSYTGQHKVDRNIMNMLLQYISEEHNSIIIGATNMLHELDPALIRKGRLGTKIYIPYPGIEAREDIFDIHLNKRRKIPNSVDLSRLAKETRFFSGSEIEDICNKAGIHLIKTGHTEVSTNDLLDLIRENPIPEHRETEIAVYQYISNHFKCYEGEGERTDKKIDEKSYKNVHGNGVKYFPQKPEDTMYN